MPRYYREDAQELRDELERIKGVDYEDAAPDRIVNVLVGALDLALNCIANLQDEIEGIEKRMRKAER